MNYFYFSKRLERQKRKYSDGHTHTYHCTRLTGIETKLSTARRTKYANAQAYAHAYAHVSMAKGCKWCKCNSVQPEGNWWEGKRREVRGRLKFSKKKKLKPHTHCTLPPYAPSWLQFRRRRGGTYGTTSDDWTIVIIVVIDRSC